MTTFAGVKSRIADDLQVGSGLASQISQQILLAVKHYRTFPFWFNEATTTLSVSDITHALPSDFISEVGLYLTESSTDRRLERWSANEIFEDRPSTAGRPTAYTIYGNLLQFNRDPDQVYVMPLHYIKELTVLSGETDENEWTTSAEDLIVYRAEKVLYDRVLKNRDEAVRCAALEREAFNALMRYNQSKVATGYTTGHYL